MKMKTIVALCLSSFFVLTACQDKEAAHTETTTTKTETATPATSEAKEAITTTEAPTAPTGEAPKLNPAHGQPFHRCDIAVGALLDSPANTAQTAPPAPQAEGPKSFFKTVQSQQQADPKPAMNAAPSPAPVQTTQTTTTQSTPAQTAAAEANTPRPKNNPAHGQPHHRCEIKVGDPLPEI